MPVQRDFKKYHKSIATELCAVKDRVRDLIGSDHWLSDGEHKEAVLRRILRGHVAQSLEIGSGFVCAENGNSTQTDILITHRNKPTLFRDGETLLVTPDAVACLIEVKTRITGGDMGTVLDKLASSAALVGKAGYPACVAGLFAYEPFANQNSHHELLTRVQQASGGKRERVVNWIAAGPDLFVRFWAKGTDVNSLVAGPVWHSYELKELSHAYFVSNVVWDTCPEVDHEMQYAWFPVEGGKESRRRSYVGLANGEPRDFAGDGGGL